MSERVALVTGAARGVGAAICRKFASQGYRILLNYNRSAEAAAKLGAELKNANADVTLHCADISDPSQVKGMFEKCRELYGHLDVLVNNASYSSSTAWNSGFGEIDWAEWQKTIEVDVKGTMLCSHEAFNMMKTSGGKIINFSSSAALQGDVPTYFYTPAKSAVVFITKTLARAYAPSVAVNCIAPGSIATDWIQNWNLSTHDIDTIIQETPLKRIGTPEEVAELVGFLASASTQFITGQTFVIDGGILML